MVIALLGGMLLAASDDCWSAGAEPSALAGLELAEGVEGDAGAYESDVDDAGVDEALDNGDDDGSN